MSAEAASPITRRTTVREAVTRYPGIQVVFERYGIMGCGGPQGPIEPIAFFARVHKVDPDALIRELNEFAGGPGRPATTLEATPVPRAPELRFLPIATAAALAVLAGFPLGTLAAFAAVRDMGLGLRWTPLVQAHGHLQLLGWVGLFIMGIAYHVVPRFKGVALRPQTLVWPSFLMLLGGVMLRTASQPWAEVPWVGALLVASAVLEVVGACAFALVITATVSSGRREAYDAFLLAAVLWLVAAAAANLLVVTELASDGVAVISQDKDEPLLAMQLYGFIVLFIFGISLRVLPVFLNLRPPLASILAPVLVSFNAGLGLRVAVWWVEAYADWGPPVAVESLAAYLLAGAVLTFILALNVYFPSLESDIVDPERAYRKLIRTAYIWLAAAAGLELWLATRAMVEGTEIGWLEAGGLRHALALGFVTQMIFGVAFRALPVFAGKRLYSQRLVDATFILVNVAAVTRVGPAVIEAGSMTSRYDHIGAAGVVGLLAVMVFAYNVARTVRAPAMPMVRVAEGERAMEPKSEQGRFVVTPNTVVAEVLDQVPGALEMLISYGLTPLADPVLRKTVTPHVTLETASRVHAFDLEALLRDLNRLASEGTTGMAPKQPVEKVEAPSSPAPSVEVDAARVLMALRNCYDPELPVNIVDLGLIYNVRVERQRVQIEMTLTAPDGPLASQVVAQVAEVVRGLGVSEVEVDLVREPPWDPSRMTPAARSQLGWE